MANSRMLIATRPVPIEATNVTGLASPCSHFVPSSRQSRLTARAGPSVMEGGRRLACKTGNDQHDHDDEDRRADPKKAPGEEVCGSHRDPRHD